MRTRSLYTGCVTCYDSRVRKVIFPPRGGQVEESERAHRMEVEGLKSSLATVERCGVRSVIQTVDLKYGR